MTGDKERVLACVLAALAGCSRLDDVFCEQQGCGWSPGEWERLTTLAGLPPPPPDPTNRWADSPAAAALGQRLFFDTGFSGLSRQADSLRRPTSAGRAPAGQPIGISCATCHDLARGGVDVSSVPDNVSVGAGVTDVNALGVVNAAYQKFVFWNGRLRSLWGLNLVVAESDTTLNGTRLQTAQVLATRFSDEVSAVFAPALPDGWAQRVKALPSEGKPGRNRGCQAGDAGEPNGDAYDCLAAPDQALATGLLVVWAKAIAAYERRLVSRNSAFDRFVEAGPGSGLLSEAATRGARLFVGKASCIDCHNGPLLSDGDFHNVGVPQTGAFVPTVQECTAGSVCDCVAGVNCFPWGAYNGLTWLRDAGPRWLPIIEGGNDDQSAASYPARSLEDDLKGAWRTPSLRDVALTAPYMHNGVYRTLEEVIWHYNTGGREVVANAVGTPSAKLKPLRLGPAEVSDLAEFLKALTGSPLPAELLVPVPPR
jgi:cytochrome c peroxidase